MSNSQLPPTGSGHDSSIQQSFTRTQLLPPLAPHIHVVCHPPAGLTDQGACASGGNGCRKKIHLPEPEFRPQPSPHLGYHFRNEAVFSQRSSRNHPLTQQLMFARVKRPLWVGGGIRLWLLHCFHRKKSSKF